MALLLKAPTDESPDQQDREARRIVENLPGFAWSADQDGTLRYVSPRFVEYTGKRLDDFQPREGGASFARSDVLHPEDVDHTLQAAAHAVVTGDPYGVEHRMRRH